jgi:hypothetical protein
MQSLRGARFSTGAPGVGPGAVEGQAGQEGGEVMSAYLVLIGRDLFNIDTIVKVNWKGDTLYDFVGGPFLSWSGEAADTVWRALKLVCVDLETGEMGKAVSKK